MTKSVQPNRSCLIFCIGPLCLDLSLLLLFLLVEVASFRLPLAFVLLASSPAAVLSKHMADTQFFDGQHMEFCCFVPTAECISKYRLEPPVHRGLIYLLHSVLEYSRCHQKLLTE